ncbi:ATP-binding protein [Desulfobaculum bizertense]|uniref:Swt1-like HEPN domain-containing protein n=1 Tax=Desulfobaculum bizertense DSM 18034 TaxID=1121442 RepID=A0A1T4VYG6_9BACT|nr:DUF499 domain-containing protein [Desulfobaculum bizertense]SKA70033.1 hypothetical protein SAMN02745702_01266 [Desulfobaculum bizertense DSM 18034]
MKMTPWREIATPHDDVLKGTFKQAEFAADISQVKAGNAGPEYQNPVNFFERTFITEGMRLLLDSVVKRISGKGGDPVIQLQTAFGGGKTHTLLSVYHLAEGKASASDLRGIAPILDDAGVTSLPQAAIAVIDGNQLSPSQPKKRGNVEVRTLWGEIAWQIGGDSGYSLVADADREGTSPGKEVLIELLKKYAPVVILMDEMVAYVRQLEEGKSYPGGTFDSNLSFIQALTEAVAAVPNALLLATLPESDTETGSVMGQKSLDALEKYFGRIQAIWKPVATEEAFEIVRRRLFNTINDTQAVDSICDSFAEFYRDNAEAFPNEVQEASYLRRLKNSYPIHPEVFTRLYEDWSSLDKFQRTRGVLQLLATVIYRLWKDGSAEPMIMPGSLPLYDPNVKNQSIYYLPQGWDPVIDKDVDGENSEPADIDTKIPHIGACYGARRAARTIFMGSAPSVQGQTVRGIEIKRIVLGAAHPETKPAIFSDAVNRLKDRLHYLNVDSDRYWFDTRPNLRREMEERKRRFDDKEDVFPEISARLGKIVNKGFFSGVHIFTASSDIPDTLDLRLVILPPDKPHSKTCEMATVAAKEILVKRGSAPRQHQNRIVFMAPDYDNLPRLKDQVKTYLAWKSIVDDVKQMRVNLDMLQTKQAEQNMENAFGGLNRMVSECYQWLMCPVQFPSRKGGVVTIEWENFRLNTSSKSIISEVEDKLVSEEMVLKVWSPIHLDNMLKQWFWKEDQQELKTQRLWGDICNYLYLPRLLDSSVLQKAIESGVSSKDYFAFADGYSGGQYKGFKFGHPASVVIDDSSVIMSLQQAQEYQAKLDEEARKKSEAEKPKPSVSGTDNGDDGGGLTPPTLGGDDTVPPAQKSTRFYSTIDLEAQTSRMKFDDIYQEIITLLTSKPGVNVRVKLDIEADASEGFDDNVQRAVRENCSTLDFKEAEFED